MSELEQFFDSLYGKETGYAHLVTFGEDDSPSSQRAFEWPKDRSFMLKYAKIRDDEDLYTGTSLSSTEDRSSDTATVTRAVYSDGDTCPPDALRLPPTLTLETSPGRYHYWWFLDETVSAQEASDASRRIAYAHAAQGMDRGFARAKLLRVPGTTNTKYDEPFRIISAWTENVYTLDTINDVYGDIDIAPQAEISKTAPKPVSEDRLRELEEQLDDAGLSHLYLERPQDGQSWSERLFRLELDLFRLGMTPQEVFSVALESAPNKYHPDNAGARTQTGVKIPKRNDPAGVLWRDVQKAYSEFLSEENVPREPRDVKPVTKANFLTLDERKFVTETPNFVDEYAAWVGKRTDAPEKYQRAIAWLLMSSFYANRGYLPLRYSPHTPLNLWMLLLGQSTNDRKTTTKNFYVRAIRAYEAQTGEVIDIGSEATAEALVKTLGERDGMVSVMHKDEVVGMFREMLAKNYMSGAIETYTELYDGSVPVVLRASKDGGNKNRATTMFNFVGFGIQKHTAEILTKAHFESGFLARMLWCISDFRPREEGSEDVAFVDEESIADRKQMDLEIMEIIKPFLKNRNKFDNEFPTAIRMDKASQARYNKWAEEGIRLAEQYGDDGILISSFRRMEISVLKAAALLAMHDGTETVTLKHLLPALLQAESWFDDMVRMAAEVSSSEFERRCNDIEEFIASGNDQQRLDSAVRKRFARFKPAEYDEIIRALQAQGRIRHPSGEGGRNKWEVLG